MSTPILATKLFIPPPRSKVVPRPRLIARLNEGLHSKLTLISAPAGFGKTTLVSEWLAATGAAAAASPQERAGPAFGRAWLSLDEGDSDLTRFLAYLVAALQSVAANLGEELLGVLHSPQPPGSPLSPAALLTTLLNEITTIPDKFVLVLDDYHTIDASTIDQALTFLLEHLPPQMHVVITTREDPQLPLARLRVRGQITEVRAADLRFTPVEAADFLNVGMGLKLSEAEVSILETRTEGWIAGLQLAALSMRGHEDVAHFVKAFAGDDRYIVEYLVEEVLQRQPENVRSFLLQSSVLDRLSGPLCDAVTGQKDGMALLDALERGNLFIVPLDDKRQWFRYHHLFAGVLAAHILQEQPTQISLLHQRASAWYAENGLPADAIRHALAAKDFVRAAGLVEVAWPAMDGRFQSAIWLGWAKALPEAFIRARPVLSVAYGWGFLNAGELETGEAWLQDAERWLESAAETLEGSPGRLTERITRMIVEDEEQFRVLPASIATARAYLAQARGDLSGTVKYGRRTLDLLPEADHLRRGPAAALLALAHWTLGDLEKAHRTLADAMTNFQKVGSLHFAISGTYGLADIRTTQGRLREAVKIYTQVLQLVPAQGEPLLRGTAELYLGLSELYREQGDAEAAMQNLLHSEALYEQAALPNSRHRFCRIQARFQETKGDFEGALKLLDEAERLYRRGPVPDVRPLAAWKARVWVAQGRLNEAQRWVHEQGLSVGDELTFLREFEHITMARVLIAGSLRDPAGRAMDEVVGLLERLQQAAEAGGRMGSVIEIGVLQAVAHQAQGKLVAALVALERALRLAEPEGYVRIFVDEGLPMARLLDKALSQEVEADYVLRLLAAFPAAKSGQPTSALMRVPESEQVEPLSGREVEVLQLIGEGLSNQEIAARLYLSPHTVKVHARNIYGKLGATSRTHAIAKGRAQGILPYN